MQSAIVPIIIIVCIVVLVPIMLVRKWYLSVRDGPQIENMTKQFLHKPVHLPTGDWKTMLSGGYKVFPTNAPDVNFYTGTVLESLILVSDQKEGRYPTSGAVGLMRPSPNHVRVWKVEFSQIMGIASKLKAYRPVIIDWTGCLYDSHWNGALPIFRAMRYLKGPLPFIISVQSATGLNPKEANIGEVEKNRRLERQRIEQRLSIVRSAGRTIHFEGVGYKVNGAFSNNEALSSTLLHLATSHEWDFMTWEQAEALARQVKDIAEKQVVDTSNKQFRDTIIKALR